MKENFRADHAFSVVPLAGHHARDILGWRYLPPYDFYDPPSEGPQEYFVRQFLRPELRFHAVLDDSGRLVGFCSFGLDGQVPGGCYTDDALDIGLGLRPELTGCGFGFRFVRSIVDHGIMLLSPERLRMTVATFNERAIHLYGKFGFVYESSFVDPDQSMKYDILVREL